MELAFLTPLLKDSTDSISGGVTIDDEGVLETQLMKNRGHTDSIDKGLEGRFMLIFPMEMAPFCAVGDQSIERCGEQTEVVNVHAVEIKESEKGT